MVEWGGGDCKGPLGNLGGHGNALHLHCGSGYMGIYIGQISLNCPLRMGVFYYI